MIRGINHRIIEVKDTNSKYFEKAILFVKPEYANLEDKLLKKESEISVDFFEGNFCYKKRGYSNRTAVIISAISAIIAFSSIALYFL